MTEALAGIRSLTNEMRRAAEQGDWEAVEAGLSDRDRLLRELLARPDAVHYADELGRLPEQDREIVALARRARDAVAAELRQLDNGRKAVHAYGGSPTRQSRRSLADADTDFT